MIKDMLIGIIVLNVVGIFLLVVGLLFYIATISNYNSSTNVRFEILLVLIGVCCMYASWELRQVNEKCVTEKSIVLPKSSKLVYKVKESVVETDDYYYRDGIYLRKARL